MVGIAYLVEVSGTLINEMLRGWLGGESSPTPCCGHCSWKKKLHCGLRSDDRFRLDTQEFISQLHLSGMDFQVCKDLIMPLNFLSYFVLKQEINDY